MTTTVAKRRLDLARNLSRSLGGDFVVVAAPDHPLVMRSVDLLIGGRAGLTAIMMSTAEERRQPKLFDARLTLNMMALPPHTAFVRVVADDEPAIKGDSTFAAEFSLNDKRVHAELTKLAETPPQTRRVGEAEKAQRRAESRFAGTYRLARVLRWKAKNDRDNFSARVSRVPSRDRLGNDVEAAFFADRPTLGAVAHLTMSDADRWYDIVEGEVQPKFSTASALFVSVYPNVSGDPDKALRAAAFAGWVMSPMQSRMSPDEVGDLIERYTRLK